MVQNLCRNVATLRAQLLLLLVLVTLTSLCGSFYYNIDAHTPGRLTSSIVHQAHRVAKGRELSLERKRPQAFGWTRVRPDSSTGAHDGLHQGAESQAYEIDGSGLDLEGDIGTDDELFDGDSRDLEKALENPEKKSKVSEAIDLSKLGAIYTAENEEEMRSLQLKYHVSDDEVKRCLLGSLKRREVSKQLPDNIHNRLATAIGDLAAQASCCTSRKMTLHQTPHFSGGKQQYRKYFSQRGWAIQELRHAVNKSTFSDVPEGTVAMVTTCISTIPFPAIAQRVPIISMSPQELKNALKIPFFQATRQLFTSLGCDYRSFHPETYYLQNRQACEELVRSLKLQQESSDARRRRLTLSVIEEEPIWFFKSRQDSFGDGVSVRSTDQALKELGDCRSSLIQKRLFIQRGVPQILRYQGRTSQGRGYLLISSYDPATVWFFMGYFNIASAPLTAAPDPLQTGNGTTSATNRKNAYVTNVRSNQKSTRLLFHEFLAEHTQEERKIAKQNVREAALTAYFALRPRLGYFKQSYTLFGFDYLIQSDMSVKVLETNCNCELFINEQNHGLQRVAISTNLVRGMMDIVLASHLAPIAYRELMREYVFETVKGSSESGLKDLDESIALDEEHNVSKEVRKSWELLYTENVHPPFSIFNLEESCIDNVNAARAQ